MNFLSIKYFTFAVLFSGLVWSNDLTDAKSKAANEHKLILLNFSGSDWCAPCIMLKKEVLSTPDFESFAANKLILLRADFPRMKKNQLPAEDKARNEGLAEKYNPEGKFPFTLLLDAQGTVIKSWDGYHGNASEILNEIKAAVNG